MLRIHDESTQPGTRHLRLEGAISGPWAVELEKMCEAAAAGGESLTLDLAAVTYIDTVATTLLRGLRQSGAELLVGSQYIAQQLSGSGSSPGIESGIE